MSVTTTLRHQIDPEPDWKDEEPIITEQPETFLYWNPRCQLVLRQRNEVYEDNPYLFFSIENVPALIRALQQKLAEFASAQEVLPEVQVEREPANRTRQAPLSAAERQRRRRDKSHGERDSAWQRARHP
jgi:hypothetical protein